jgi:hypothetical protein
MEGKRERVTERVREATYRDRVLERVRGGPREREGRLTGIEVSERVRV